MTAQGSRGSQSVRPARTNGADAVGGIDHVSLAREHQRATGICHDQEGLQASQRTVGAPELGQLDRGPHQVRGRLLELRFESFQKGERVSRRAGESHEDAPALDPHALELPDLDGVDLGHRVAERYLTIAGDRDTLSVTNRDDRGSEERGHHEGSVSSAETRWGGDSPHRETEEYAEKRGRFAPPTGLHQCSRGVGTANRTLS